ncbi:type II CAAX prenyl endopeptidase Rce1 family protein [Staphylococcus massiliensis]|uniref:Abortive infection family protein n=1 Tax=Staphylococcus massiliensis S46 TaxID=1229783 RepID=K9B2W6_9STAP|nr:CPBP family glutamic-type intramembrane protease [Staphylococcus massiliensis]EKU48120.1 abortive infection family protein [Staphylococcus massiliensis S46]MCG3399834.1 CPBP family intramembrane metalloprotease [Staphylococcus massiliensis]PNZ98205.1 CPBP family intramembrane metalloprotease [Staphylococcus massiliensis CCUG 55927]
MKHITKPLIWFIVSFIIFHIILMLMHGEHKVYWFLYTGIMLIVGISYIFYQRDINSKRLLPSIGVGFLASIALILLQVILSFITKYLSYNSLIKTLASTGVIYKWQLLITLLFAIPCHELYMRTVLQKELIKIIPNKWIIMVIVAIASSSLFIYLDKWWLVLFIFVSQLLLAFSYHYTRRIITTVIAQVVSVILILMIHGL